MTLQEVIDSHIDQIKKIQPKPIHSKGLATNWIGVRSGVEVPRIGTEQSKKKLGIELVNRNYMLYDGKDDYWREELEKHYDSFNYFSTSGQTSGHKFYWRDNGRVHPKGIITPKPDK